MGCNCSSSMGGGMLPNSPIVDRGVSLLFLAVDEEDVATAGRWNKT